MKNIKKILFSTTIAAVIFIVSSVPALGSPGGVWIEPTSTGIKVVSSVSTLGGPGGWIDPSSTSIKIEEKY